MDIYVGNLPYDADDEDLEQAFSQHGSVAKAKVILDRETGRSKGFAFITMENADEANNAIQAMNGADFGGRPLRVNEARPREDRPQRRF